MAETNTIVLTLDVEADGGGFPGIGRSFDSFASLPRLLQALRERELPLTGFVEGEILAKRRHLVGPLTEFGADLQCHAYDHDSVGQSPRERVHNMDRGIEAYHAVFGRVPRGFRSPQGITGQPDLARLAEHGVEYDSSVYPCYFPGRFNNFSAPVTPYRQSSGITELPLGALGRYRYPIALSFIQLIGWPVYRTLFDASLKPDTFVFNLHLHDLQRGDWYLNDDLPRSIRYGYKATLRGDPFAVLLKFLDHALKKGYRFATMDAWMDHIESEGLPSLH